MEVEMHPDLFGGESPMMDKVNGPYQKKFSAMKVRKAEGSDPKCKSCVNLIRKSLHGKAYFKCALIGDSNSTATDIRASYTCTKHEPTQDQNSITYYKNDVGYLVPKKSVRFIKEKGDTNE